MSTLPRAAVELFAQGYSRALSVSLSVAKCRRACKATDDGECCPLCREKEDVEEIFIARVPNSTPVRRVTVTGGRRRQL